MKRIIALFGYLFLTAMLPAANGAPATSAYDVEVLVFENHLPDLDGGELWTHDKSRPAPDFSDAVTGPNSISGDSFLGTAAAALQKDGGYKVLSYRRWRQTADEKSATRPMRLRDSDGNLDGAVRFYMSRFLHVDVDVVLKDTTAPEGELSYRLSEHRRIKTQEINYFDHPKVGVLVRVTPAAKE